MSRMDGRAFDELRPVKFETDFVKFPEGSVLVTCELQGTGEGRAFSVDEQRRLVDLCQKGIRELMAKQRAVLEGQK